MIFASDLDRTLIYTKKLIKDSDRDIILAERYLDKELSFMKKDVLEKLMNIRSKILFIPVTTRTIEQYNRIFLITDYIKPDYAVVSNGGNILIKGEVDREWKEIINRKVSKIVPHLIVKKRFLESFEDTTWIERMVFRDELFYSVHFLNKELINLQELEEFKSWVEDNEWHISLQGRKLYIVPNCVNKWDALLYIKERENKSKVISAGDSFLDYPILINAEHPICASHGELKALIEGKKVEQRHISMTKSSGISASEDIVKIVNDLICQNV